MEGSLVKNNTTGGAEYSRKVFCVLMGYTLWEFDTEADARAGLWPRAEADVIGVSPAPSNSSTLRSTMVSMTSSRSATDAALTFVYTTTAGERVCAVAPSAGECDRWQVALTLGVELLLLTGLAEGAGGAATCVPHEPPQPDASASHCAASGAAFGYTVARHTCAASGRAFAAAHMAPAPLPLPGIGLGHAAKLSDACAQAQQLLNASRCRARLLAAAAHGADLEQTLERKFKADRKPLWLLHKDQLDAPPPAPLLSLDGSAPPPPPANTRDEAAKAACGILLSDAPLSDPEYLALFNTCREAARDAADRSYDAYVAQVLDGMRGDAAALIDDGDAAFARDQDVLRSRLPSSSHGVAVRDVLVALLHALATLGVAPAEPVVDLSAPESPGGKAKQYFETDRLGSSSGLRRPPCVPPDDVLAREMRFVRAMCDVAEAMRSVEHGNRPARLKKELEALPRRTPLAHSPINATYVVTESGARSLHLGRVARIPPNEGHVFKTKARAPTLMLLETVDDPKAGADLPARAASPSPLVGGSDSDTSDDVVALELLEQTRASERDKELAELLAKQLGDVAPEPEDGEPVSPGTPRGRPALSASAMKRVCSVPSIVDAACGSDDEGPQRDDDGDEPGDRTPPPPRRVASATTLSVLAEGETPREGDDDAASQPEKRSVSPVPPPDFGSESGEAFASEPVASGSRDRAEVVRALRKKPALGLKIERLSSITGPGLGGGGSPEAAESEGVDGAADAPEKPDELLGDVVVVPSPEPEGAPKKKWVPGFGEPWVDKRERIRRSSPIGGEPTWNLVSCIVKSNDDLRQEVCALQIIAACNDAFEAAGLGGDETGLWLRHYSIVPTGASTGIIETMADAVSLDGLKKAKEFTTLKHHFHVAHGGDGSLRHAKARKAFVSSMAAYSLVCHLLGLKDRHNGNILLDSFGHVIHIDFGFLLGQAPGGSFSLERVPFKLTAEHVDAMGGWSSDGFADFVVLLACGFAALQKHASKILHLVEIMAKDSPFPCFKNGPACVDKMRAKLKLHFTTKEQVAHHVAELVRQSYNAYGTRQYDSFQYLTNGIYS
ncbi:1-phosphatidylinositol 4-kinase [Aureococcus anophagefferens]|uniref:1-phosphatidylinositol 4-kinase n=1 Tax=Aureococcus anophagefferens TaxID=44056 RepID=A0ABR1FGP1_AURAN